MNLSERLQCPDCQGRLATDFARELVCSGCGRTAAVVDGIVDLISGLLPVGADRYSGVTREGLLAADLPARIKATAGSRWPTALGDTIEIGCGLGEMTEAIATDDTVRSLLVIDSDADILNGCRTRIEHADLSRPLLFAAIGGGLGVIRDAVADTVIGTAALSGIGDTRAFLTTVHRLLKAGGRALFVVPNRRYRQAVCMAIAAALTQRYSREGAWPHGCEPVLSILEETRRLLMHPANSAYLAALEEKQLFDSDALEDLGRQVGFGSAEISPLSPDLAGGQTITRFCQDCGASDDFARSFGPLAATVGRPYLSLLDHQDSSALSLLWLTKSAGPTVRIFTNRSSGPPVVFTGPEAAVAGLMPRWSVEMVARDTPEGVVVSVGGWCLTNIDAPWVQITLDGVVQRTPVWRHRLDVHEVLNRANVYHPLNALCSGIAEDLLFVGVHPADGECKLRLEIILAGGMVVTGPAPEQLRMGQPTVIAH